MFGNHHTSSFKKGAIARAALVSIVLVAAFASGCGASGKRAGSRTDGLDLAPINALRASAGLEPLERDATLDGTALTRARASAATDDTPNPRLVAAGCFSRFALSHAAKGGDAKEALAALIADPLGRSKAAHGALTHVGFGFDPEGGVLVADFAKLAPVIDAAVTEADIARRMDAARVRNSAEPLEKEPRLDALAKRVAADYMAGKGTSDALIDAARKEIGQTGFSFGRVTIAFQVVGDTIELTVPERLNDPALAFLGVGAAQGNLAAHEPGSVALVLIAAEPQGAHSEARTRSDMPPPKPVPVGGGGAAGKGSLVDQAWMATLTANHDRAASLFEQAFRRSKSARDLYEAGRAYARAKRFDKAIATLGEYSKLVEGEEKAKAESMVARLEKGESIFDTSEQALMSVEAKRFFIIGQRLFEQGEWDGAIDAFQQVHAYAAHPDLLYNIGLAHLKAGRIGMALDFFGEYQRAVPQATSVEQAKQLFQLGVELYSIGQYEAASKRFAMAYSFMPAPDLLYNLALCHRALGEDEEALRLLREFLFANPDTPDRDAIQAQIDELSKGADD